MSNTVLILGASGRFGRHMSGAFRTAGWQVQTFNRTTDSLESAAEGTDVIVNGWNPPYTAWAKDIPHLTEQVIAAARAANATVILPGNVYVYGEGSDPILTADTPHNAQNPLGRIRVEMEKAYRQSGVRTILIRAGDFLDTSPSGNWFDKIIAAKAARGRIVSPGNPATPHAWAYLPDLARAAAALAAQRDALSVFEDIPFPGYTLSIDQIAALITQASGRPQRVEQMNWLPLKLAAPFWPMGRKLLEMRYLWSMPHTLDDKRLKALLPDFKSTAPLAAITQAITHLDLHPDQPMA